jgi:acetate kinase
MKVAVLNCGSSSIRYEVSPIQGWGRTDGGREIARQTVEVIRRGKGGNG